MSLGSKPGDYNDLNTQNMDVDKMSSKEVFLWLNKIPGTIYFGHPVDAIKFEVTDKEARSLLRRIVRLNS